MTRAPAALDRDVVRTVLDPASGVVRSYALHRLSPPVSMHAMTVDIGTRFAGTAEPTAHDRVGAVDLTPAGALVRGTGEAVERYALAPRDAEPLDHVVGSRDELVAGGSRYLDPARWPGLPHPERRAVTRWYRGVDATDGTPLWVPAAVVDWPTAPTSEGWQGTPSGAAAHTGHDAAVEAALREVLERDALMAAWRRADRAGASVVDLGPPGAADPRIARLAADRDGASVGAARIPSAVPTAHAYVGWVDDGRVLAVGAGLDPAEGTGVLAALREAWQIYGLLSTWEPGTEATTDGFVAGAEARCAYWADGRGRAEFVDWLAPLAPALTQAHDAAPSTAHDDLLRELTAGGRCVVVVDLTPRLPAPVRQAGMHAVKVLVEGLQPLLLLDDERWSVVPQRIGPAPRPDAGPHPLI